MDLSQYLASAALTAPDPPASPSVGYPTAGNPATGTAATRPGAYWHYQIQAELTALLTAAGITPDHEDLAQMPAAVRGVAWTDPDLTGEPTAPNADVGTRGTRLATMQSFATEFPASLSENGWQKLPSGLLIQWCRAAPGALTNNATVAVTFPVAFPSAVLAVILGDTAGMTTASASEGAYVSAKSVTGCTITVAWNSWPAGTSQGGPAVADARLDLLAIGY